MTNTQLKKIIQKIVVDKDGNVDIYLRILGDLGLEEAVLINDNYTQGCCRMAFAGRSLPAHTGSRA